jgi:hypothetical protein
MRERYAITESNIVLPIFGSIIKYSSLMLGVYSVCKDERDFALTALGCFGYLCGDMMKLTCKNNQDKKNLSELEESLKE